jgi:hypothetical protein
MTKKIKGETMKTIMPILLVFIAVLFFSCAGKEPYHKTPMPAPESFNAHFGDLDTNDDERVTWDEFKAYFPDAESNVFKAIDLNKDGVIDHDEWHQFKEAHGLKKHD